jgi:predicted NAD/FAD-dependent oxidoreductase
MQDSLLGGSGASNLLLPKIDLASLFPSAAATWLQAHGGEVRLGTRVEQLRCGDSWHINDESFDAVIWATSASNTAPALIECAQAAPELIATPMQAWAAMARALQFEAITTVYAYAPGVVLPQPMLALRSHPEDAPAQFVFDRGQLGGPPGLLALVVSASTGERDALQAQVLTQAHTQLQSALQGRTLQAIQTVVEKRATFACTPCLQRPPQAIAPGLVACGDYVEGPYPATLEGAVRSGCDAIKILETR